MDESSERGFERFVAAEGSSLLRFAYLLAGGREAAEDLLQSALERCYRHWRRVERTDRPDRYVRRVLANAAVDRWRLRRRTPELPLSAAAEPVAVDGTESLLARDELLRALRTLSPRQRVVVVLRYVEDLSEVDTAAHPGRRVPRGGRPAGDRRRHAAPPGLRGQPAAGGGHQGHLPGPRPAEPG